MKQYQQEQVRKKNKISQPQKAVDIRLDRAYKTTALTLFKEIKGKLQNIWSECNNK